MNQFKVGDRVEWTSQAGGFSRTKMGTVVCVLPPDKHPAKETYKVDTTGMSRNHESYIVEVRTPYKKPIGGKTERIEHFWPVVSQLHKVSGPFLMDVIPPANTEESTGG